jgi:hypothetical protein
MDVVFPQQVDVCLILKHKIRRRSGHTERKEAKERRKSNGPYCDTIETPRLLPLLGQAVG